jgi:hypothetical protein
MDPRQFKSFVPTETEAPTVDATQFKSFVPMDVAPPAPAPAAAAVAPDHKPNIGDDIQRGGGQVLQGVGSTMRDIGMPNLGLSVEQTGDQIVAANPSEINSISDIAAKPVTTVREAVGEAVPQVGLSLGGAAAGAAAGGAAGSLFAGVGAIPGAVVGGAVGAFGASLPQEYGGIRKTQRELGTDDKVKALGYGAAASAIDMLGPEASVPRKVGTNVVRKAITAGGEGLVKRVVKGAVVEGATEAAQTELERAGAGQELTGSDALNDVAVSAAKGAAGGGAISVVEGGHKAQPARTAEAQPISTTAPEDLIQRGGPRNEGDTQLDLFPDAPETSPLIGTIQAAAAKHGVDPQTLLTIGRIESNLDPNADNPVSSAGGLFQFTDRTAKFYGLTDKNDPAQSSDAAARMLKDSQSYLTKRLGREPEPWELYLAHQQGPGGAARLLANPDAPAESIVGHDAVVNNGGEAGMTAGQFADIWRQKFDKAGGGRAVIPGGPTQPAVFNAEADETDPFGQMTLLQQMRGDGKPTAETIKLSKTVSSALQAGDPVEAGRAIEDVQAKLDAALLKLDEQQKALDDAADEHGVAQHRRFQAEIDSKLDGLTTRQNALAVARSAVQIYGEQSATQGELDLQPMPAQAPMAPAPVMPQEPAPQPAPQPAASVMREPQGPAVPASSTLLADQLRGEEFADADARAEQSVRSSILRRVLESPDTRNPERRFVALLKRAGKDPTLSDAEADTIATHLAQDTTLGVPEAKPPGPAGTPGPAPQDTIIRPRAEPVQADRPFNLTQQTPDDLHRLDAAQTRREAKAARPQPEAAGAPTTDLFDPENNTRRRAAQRANTMGSTRREWFNKGVDDGIAGRRQAPDGKTRTKAYDEGQAFVDQELGNQRGDRGDPGSVAAEPADTAKPEAPKQPAAKAVPAVEKPSSGPKPKDVGAFQETLENALTMKMVTSSQYQQLRVLSEQGALSPVELDDMLDNAIRARQEAQAKFTGKKARLDEGSSEHLPPEAAQLERDLRRTLDRMGLHDVAVRAVPRVLLKMDHGGANVAGDFEAVEQLIRIAFDGRGDKFVTLHHEAVHALRELNVFTDGEWTRLAQLARDMGMLDWAQHTYGDQDLAAEAIVEEAIAEMYARWQKATLPKSQAAALMQRIRDFIRAIRQVFTNAGYSSGEDILNDIRSGAIGRRQRGTSRLDGKIDAAAKAARIELPEPLAAPVHAIVKSLELAGKAGHIGVTFTEDVAALARNFMPSAKRFIELNSRSHAIARQFEERLLDIKRDYQDLEAKVRGTGKGSVNALLDNMTQRKAWAFQPAWIKTPVTLDPELKAAYDALPPKAQATVRAVFNHGHETRAQLLTGLNSRINAEFDPDIAAAQSPEERKILQDRKARALKMVSRIHDADPNVPYAPRRRSGDWAVIGMSAQYKAAKDAGDSKVMDELRSNPDHYWANFYDTGYEADAMRAKVAEKYAHAQYFQRSKVTDADISGAEIYLAFGDIMGKVQGMVAADPSDANKSLARLARDLYLHSLAEASARKSELKSFRVDATDPVTGEKLDMMKAFVTHGQATTHFIAALHNAPEISKAIRDMAKEAQGVADKDRTSAERLRNSLMYRYTSQLNLPPHRLVNKITRGVSVWNLLLSPAYYATNLMQVEQMSVPLVAGRVGYMKAQAQFMRAYREVAPMFRSISERMKLDDAPADVKDLLQHLLDRGRLDAGLSQELGDWQMGGEGVLPTAWNAVDSVLRYLPQNIETLNRVVTGIAAYRSAKALGDSEAAAREYASKVIFETHGDYSGFNAPGAMTRLGGFGKIALQFRKFQLIQAAYMVRLVNQSLSGETKEQRMLAMKALAFTLAHAGVLTGLVGMPAAATLGPIVMMLIGAATGDDKDWKDWETSLHKWLDSQGFPQWFSDLLYKGAPYAGGVDMSGKVGMSNMTALFPYTDAPTALKDRDSFAATVGQIAGGALMGIGGKLVDGAEFLRDQDYYRALEAIAPTGVIQGSLKAARLETRGVETKSGDRLLKPEEIDAAASVLAVLGFQPSQLADQSERRSAAFQAGEHYKDETTHLKRRYARAAEARDTQAMAKLRAEWEELQAARQRQGFKRQPMATLLKAPREQAKREAQVIAGVPTTKQNRGFVKQMAGSED